MTATAPQNEIQVLHSVGSLNRGGIETWLMNIVRQKPKELRADFIVSTPGGTYEEELRQLGSKVYYVPKISRIQKRFEIVGLAPPDKTLERVLQHQHYDIFHAHGTEFLGDAVRRAAQCGIRGRIAHCHTTGIGRFNRNPELWIRGIRFRTLDRQRIRKYATDILAASNEAGQFLMSGYWNQDTRCKLAYCGIPLTPFLDAERQWTREAYRKKLGIPQDAVVIGHAGSMWQTRVKNHFFLLRVFEVLAKRDKRFLLFMAGEGPLRPSLQRAVYDMNLQSRVMLPGLCTDVPSLMVHAFDVHALPSLYEGLPVVGLEAAASGLHTVCSDTITKDFTEQLASRVTAVSLKSSVASWADEIEKSVSKRVSVQAGTALLEDSPFSINSSLQNLLSIYRERLH